MRRISSGPVFARYAVFRRTSALNCPHSCRSLIAISFFLTLCRLTNANSSTTWLVGQPLEPGLGIAKDAFEHEIAGQARNDGWAWNDGGMDSATTRRMTIFLAWQPPCQAAPDTPSVEGNWGTLHCHPGAQVAGSRRCAWRGAFVPVRSISTAPLSTAMPLLAAINNRGTVVKMGSTGWRNMSSTKRFSSNRWPEPGLRRAFYSTLALDRNDCLPMLLATPARRAHVSERKISPNRGKPLHSLIYSIATVAPHATDRASGGHCASISNGKNHSHQGRRRCASYRYRHAQWC